MCRPLVLVTLLTVASGFVTPHHSSRFSATTTSLFEAKINGKIDLDSAKVVNQEQLCVGDKKVYCRCWKSETFPLCDGAHVAHNKEKGDNVGPLILTAEMKQDEISPVDAKPSDDTTKQSVLGKLKSMFGMNKDKVSDGLTTRERLAKMGLSALLSYGWVSNMSYAVTLSLSWYGFSKKTGLGPLAPGQWKPFLAVYAGFYVFNNIIRPLRFGASVVVSKYFDNFVGYIQDKTKLSRKWSIAVVVFLANVLGTFTAMGLGVSLAAAAAGVPIFPPKV